MANNAGEVHSFRLPSGVANRIRELSGQRVSTIARTLLVAYLKQLEMEEAKK